MLVLARKLGEEIVIDDCIRLKVVSIQGGTVRLGLDAPRSIGIERGELRARREAATTTLLESDDESFDALDFANSFH